MASMGAGEAFATGPQPATCERVEFDGMGLGQCQTIWKQVNIGSEVLGEVRPVRPY